MKIKVISIITEKGGVGKTTTIHLGAVLTEKKEKSSKISFSKPISYQPLFTFFF